MWAKQCFATLKEFPMSTATLTCKTRLTDLSDAHLEGIFLAHRIPQSQWQEFKDLVFYGTRPSKEMRRRLNRVANYRAALQFILLELSQRVKHLFPDANWNPAR
jgi:hypothetical protein